MSKRGKRRKNRYSPIDKHTRTKSVLVAAINRLPVQPIQWERDLLPEHLWLEMLFNNFVRPSALKLYIKFVESLQPYCSQNGVMYGYISDFGLIPPEVRAAYLSNNAELVESAFRKPIGDIITLYPDSPCSWLVEGNQSSLTNKLRNAKSQDLPWA